MKSGTNLITDERARHTGQILNYSEAHDNEQTDGQLLDKAVSLLDGADISNPIEYGRNLVKAGALIAAEIDRLQRTGIQITAPPTEPPAASQEAAAKTEEAEVTEEEEEEVEEPGTETAKQLEENNRHEDLVQLAADEEVEINPRENKITIAKAIVKARKKKAKASQ